MSEKAKDILAVLVFLVFALWISYCFVDNNEGYYKEAEGKNGIHYIYVEE